MLHSLHYSRAPEVFQNRRLALGITGTQDPDRDRLWVVEEALYYLFTRGYQNGGVIPDLVITGGCIGIDAHAATHIAALSPEVQQVVILPKDKKKTSFWFTDKKWLRVMEHPPVIFDDGDPYLKRNRKIAWYSDLLYAFPKAKKELQRSGTWATVRYAREYSIDHLIFPLAA